MLIPLVCLAIGQSSAEVISKPGSLVDSLLVVSLRHPRLRIEHEFPDVLGDEVKVRKAMEPLGYEMFHDGSMWMAVDRAIFGQLPQMIEARATQFFARRNYAPCKASELPPELHEAAIQRIMSTQPNLTEAQTDAMNVSIEPTVWLRVQPPAGMGKERIEWLVPPKSVWPQASSLTLPEFPIAEVAATDGGKGLPLQLFTVRDSSVASTLALWDRLRPLMREAEDQYEKTAHDAQNVGAVAVRSWLEAKIDAKKGEEKAFGGFSTEAQGYIAEATEHSPKAFDGAKMTILQGGYSFRWSDGNSSNFRMPINLLSRVPLRKP